MNGMPNALEGVRVIDLSQFLAGPTCTILLAQLGAEVIKLEQPGRGEQSRPTDGGQNKNGSVTNGNKKSITLNLKTAEGKDVLRRLIKESDVLFENFAPGAIERLGFSYEEVEKINPRCIFCSIKGYSEFSPYANFPAMDGPVQATGTLASQTGLKGSQPVLSNAPLADDPAGRMAAMAIMAALLQREKTGKGQKLRVNMQEVEISLSRPAFAMPELVPKRGEAMKFTGENAPRNMFRTKPRFDGDEDNYVFILVHDTPGQKRWKAFCDAIGRPDMFEDPRFVDGAHRYANMQELDAEILKFTTQHDKEEIMKLLCGEGITAGAVLTIQDMIAAEDMYKSGFLQKIVHPRLGEMVVQNLPFHMSDTYVPYVPSPDLGQDNEDIYKGVLGMTDGEFEALKNNNII